VSKPGPKTYGKKGKGKEREEEGRNEKRGREEYREPFGSISFGLPQVQSQ
jgi:hypothetical protein